jgi:hypothetical protein
MTGNPRLSWSKVFADNLPSWAMESKSAFPKNIILFTTVTPVLIGTYFGHVGLETDRRIAAVATLNYAACTQITRTALHSGLQSSFFGLPARTMAWHPLIAASRYVSAFLPLGLALVALRASVDFPHLSARYLIYSYIASTTFDLMGHIIKCVPMWYLKTSFLSCFLISGSIAVLGSSETLMVDSSL